MIGHRPGDPDGGDVERTGLEGKTSFCEKITYAEGTRTHIIVNYFSNTWQYNHIGYLYENIGESPKITVSELL